MRAAAKAAGGRESEMTGAPWRWSRYVLAWLPLAVWYALTTRASGYSWEFSIGATVLVLGMAAAMGVGVWVVSGWIPAASVGSAGNGRDRLSFVGRHILLAACYATILVALEVLVSASYKGKPLDVFVLDRRWSILQAVVLYSWLYGLVAGVSYSVRAHQALRDHEVAAARAEAQAVQAQLRALRAQLNPHFLFNSLHSLSALVRHDPAVAEQAIEHLGDMLRYALDENAAEDLPLADEWRFVQHYLALEQLRLGDRLRLSVDIEPDALDVNVPCFALQPLVENAVRHAVAPRPSGATVRISARLMDGALVIRVADDGPGADREATGRATGLGLRALARRLEARYGGRAGFLINTAPGAGFAVTLSVPLAENGLKPEQAGVATPVALA